MKTKNRRRIIAAFIIVLAAALVFLIALAVWPRQHPEEEQPSAEAFREDTEETEEPPTDPPPELTDKAGLLHNPLAPTDFLYHGSYLTCTAAETAVGIDVSFWQGDIHWDVVQAAGMEFAMIRLGFRGTQSGGVFADECVQANYDGAREAGIQVGGYFFSQAISVEEAVEEAEFVLELIRDWQIDMPIVYDWEYVSDDARTGSVGPRLLTDCTRAFCQTIEEAGYEAMIYFNENQSHKKMYLEELTDYKFWLAKYEEYLDYPYRVDMWQYTCEGRVPGVDGYVDVNLYFTYS